MPALAVCAGLIVLAREVVDGRADQHPLGAIDVTVRRNGYGRQRESFEAGLTLAPKGSDPFPGVFIRAPVVERVGPGVEVLAEYDGHAVLGRDGRVLFATFHPELAADLRVHQLFLDS
jgi:5'-phosphate synthase pdxT subunit